MRGREKKWCGSLLAVQTLEYGDIYYNERNIFRFGMAACVILGG